MPIDPLAHFIMETIEDSRKRDIQLANEEMAETQRKLEKMAREHPEILPSRRAMLVLGITGVSDSKRRKEARDRQREENRVFYRKLAEKKWDEWEKKRLAKAKAKKRRKKA